MFINMVQASYMMNVSNLTMIPIVMQLKLFLTKLIVNFANRAMSLMKIKSVFSLNLHNVKVP